MGAAMGTRGSGEHFKSHCRRCSHLLAIKGQKRGRPWQPIDSGKVESVSDPKPIANTEVGGQAEAPIVGWYLPERIPITAYRSPQSLAFRSIIDDVVKTDQDFGSSQGCDHHVGRQRHHIEHKRTTGVA